MWRKQKQTNHDDDQSEWKEIALPPFYLSAKVTSFGNDDTRISTVIYAVTCHLDNAKSIKTLLSRASKTSLYTNHNDSAHFVLYELIQYTSPTTYRSKILQQNQFLHKLAIIPVFNITNTVIHSNIIPSLKKGHRFQGVE